jgi:hypothetical protein
MVVLTELLGYQPKVLLRLVMCDMGVYHDTEPNIVSVEVSYWLKNIVRASEQYVLLYAPDDKSG